MGTDDSPSGHLESVIALPDGRALVTGWAADRNSAEPVQVAVLVGGRWVEVDHANWTRPDVDEVHGIGVLRGFRVDVAGVAEGDPVCVSAVNVGAGVHSLLGCRRVAAAPPAWTLSPDCDAAPAPGVNLAGCNLDGRFLPQANLEGADLSNTSLNGTYLELANLDGADLSGSSLNGARLQRASLRDANLSRARITGSLLTEAMLDRAQLGGALILNTDMGDVSLRNADATGTLFSNTQMALVRVEGLNATRASFFYGSLRSVDLRRANFRNAFFTRTNLIHAVLPSDGAGFEGAGFMDVVCPDGSLDFTNRRCGMGPR
ncbi:MAG: pentapeptide repeat-containing protein [Microthrixaceae bacterium]